MEDCGARRIPHVRKRVFRVQVRVSQMTARPVPAAASRRLSPQGRLCELRCGLSGHGSSSGGSRRAHPRWSPISRATASHCPPGSRARASGGQGRFVRVTRSSHSAATPATRVIAVHRHSHQLTGVRMERAGAKTRPSISRFVITVREWDRKPECGSPRVREPSGAFRGKTPPRRPRWIESDGSAWTLVSQR
jgi:hypothetical protein